MVANPIQPRDGIITPKLTELWSVGGDNDPQGDLVNQPFEIRLAADGTVYVSDRGDVCIRVFDAKGKFLRQVGRKGQGPGDYDTPFFIDVDAQNRVHVLDMQSQRVTKFDPIGKYESSFRMEKAALQIRLDGQGRIFCGEISRGETQPSSEFKTIQQYSTIVRYDPDGRNPSRSGPYPSMKMMMKAMPGGGVISTSSRDGAQTCWSVSPDGKLWLGNNETYELGVFDPDGKPLFRFGREYKPVQKKASDVIPAENRKSFAAPEFFPAFATDFFFDEAGNAWFRLYRNDDKAEPYRYDVFSPQGVYLKQYVLPCRIYQVRNGKMIAVVETEEGFRALKCYQY
jgi:hypothetical protein